jgi:CBS-domain-containing membrane protein
MAIHLVGVGHGALVGVTPTEFVTVQPTLGETAAPVENPRDLDAVLAGAKIQCHRRGPCPGEICADCAHLAAFAARPNERALTLYCIASSEDRVHEWMTPASKLVFGHPQMTCEEADARAAEHGVHRLLVLDDERALVGTVCRCDLAGGGAAPVETRMIDDVFAIGASERLGAAISAMAWLRVGSLPVLSTSGLLIGLLTWADLKRAGAPI